MDKMNGRRSSLANYEEYRKTQQVRAAIWAAALIILGGVTGIVIIGYSFFAGGKSDWQVLVVGIATAIPVIGALIAIPLARRQRVEAISWLIILSIWISVLIISLLVQNIGEALSLVALLITLVLAVVVMPQRTVVWVIILGVLSRFGVIALNQYLVGWQFPVPGLEAVLPTIILTTLLGFGVLILWRFRTLSLTTKLVLLFLVLTLVGSTIITYNFTVTTSTALRENIGAGLKSQADAQARLIGDLIQEELTSLRALATSEVLRDAVLQKNAAYPADEALIQAEVARLDAEWINQVAQGETTGQLFSSYMDNEAAGVLLEFRRILADNVEVFMTDLYGGLVATTNVTSDYAQADEAWWQVAYGEGQGSVYISSPEYDESSNSTSILAAVPIINPATGKPIGILRTTYIVDPILRSLAFVKLGTTGGVDIYFPGTVYQHVEEGKMQVADPHQIELLQSVEEITYGEILYEENDSLVSRSAVISTAQDPAVDNLGWYIVAHQQSNEALAAVQLQTRNTLILVSIIVVVVSLGAVGLARAITGPIVRLTDVANRVRGGDLNSVALSETVDEVGTLADSFNQMTSQLRQILGGLEQRIAERTRELTLSAEVGHRLSQVRDVDTLLNQAVELIQFSFDLYYTQVYLADPTGRVLILRAGTGDVGAELLRRRHRLAVGSGSINGLAVSEQRAILVSDTETSSLFHQNPLLPETRSELSVPLIIGDRVLGVLDMQSARSGALSDENLAAFETLAGQLASAIENARLIQQAEQSRGELELQARRLSSQGWIEYLDAIQRSERLGYVFDGETIQSLPVMHADIRDSADASSGDVLYASIEVLGQKYGQLALEREAEKKWSQSDQELVELVAGQVARQIENLRLLAQAEQYRIKAEEAARRLTREGWEGYLQEVGEKEYRFVYDGQRVQESNPEIEIATPEDEAKTAYIQPLRVRDVAIGELALYGDQVGDEDRDLVQFIAERLGEHIENLRLTAQTENALTSTEALYTGSEAIVRSRTVNSALLSLVEASALIQFDHASIMLFDSPWVDQMPVAAEVAGTWNKVGSDTELQEGVKILMKQVRYVMMLQRGQPFYIPDLQDIENVDERRRGILADLGRSIALFPLVTAEQWIGWLAMTADKAVYLTEAHLRQVQSLIGQAAAVIQGIRLLQQTEARARREQTLRQVSERLRSSVDPEQVLRFAVKEVSDVLGRNVLIRVSSSTREEAEIEGGFYSDRNEVRPAGDQWREEMQLALQQDGREALSNQKKTIVALPLKVRGDILGAIAVQADTQAPLTEEESSLLSEIADQIALAWESARLFTQTQLALAQTEMLYSIIAEMNSASGYQDILGALSKRVFLSKADQLLMLGIFDRPLDRKNQPDWIYPVAYQSSAAIEVAKRYPLTAFQANPNTLFTSQPEIINDIATDPRLDRITRTLFQDVFKAESSVVVPLILGSQTVGFVQGFFSQPVVIPTAEGQLLAAVAGQAAIAVQSRLLLEQAQSRARQEARIREVTAQVFNATDVDAIMRRAAEQIGRVLGVPAFVYLGEPVKERSPGDGVVEDAQPEKLT
jgi:GAF domain-containing protein/HAMP domain-containing protein